MAPREPREAQHRITVAAQAIAGSPARQAEVGSIPDSVPRSRQEPGGTASSDRAASARWFPSSLDNGYTFWGISLSPPNALSILQPSSGPAVLSSWPSTTPVLPRQPSHLPRARGSSGSLDASPATSIRWGQDGCSCQRPRAAPLLLSPGRRWKGARPGSGSPPVAWGPGAPGGSDCPLGGIPAGRGGRRGWGLNGASSRSSQAPDRFFKPTEQPQAHPSRWAPQEQVPDSQHWSCSSPGASGVPA